MARYHFVDLVPVKSTIYMPGSSFSTYYFSSFVGNKLVFLGHEKEAVAEEECHLHLFHISLKVWMKNKFKELMTMPGCARPVSPHWWSPRASNWKATPISREKYPPSISDRNPPISLYKTESPLYPYVRQKSPYIPILDHWKKDFLSTLHSRPPS